MVARGKAVSQYLDLQVALDESSNWCVSLEDWGVSLALSCNALKSALELVTAPTSNAKMMIAEARRMYTMMGSLNECCTLEVAKVAGLGFSLPE